ncbi:MAG TPA: hypothetical protein VIT38_08020 [Allosphingosinicella sp.]
MGSGAARILVALALLGAAPAASAFAQAVYASAQPAPNSPQRRAILDALRPAVARALGNPIEFVVTTARVHDGWALVVAEPQRPGGGRIDIRRAYPRDWENMDGLTVTAILRFRGGRWTLVDHAIGATDVWYCGGATGAPRALTNC